MSWYNPVSWFAGKTMAQNEAAVLQLVQQITNGIKVAEADANAAYAWIGANGPEIIVEVNNVMVIVLEIASIADPRVAAAVAAVNAFTAALNAVVKARGAEEDFVHAIVDAYKAFKDMQAHSAAAVASVIK